MSDDRWKTAEARNSAGIAATAWRFLDHLSVLKGSLHYYLHGEGSLRDEGPRPPGGRQPQVPRFTPQEQRVLKDFERKIDRMEDEVKQFAREGRKVDEIIG